MLPVLELWVPRGCNTHEKRCIRILLKAAAAAGRRTISGREVFMNLTFNKSNYPITDVQLVYVSGLHANMVFDSCNSVNDIPEIILHYGRPIRVLFENNDDLHESYLNMYY